MAKSTRAKRANRPNPRTDRNIGPVGGTSHKRASNVVELNIQKPKKKHVDIIPKNLNQELLLEYLESPEKNIIFATGPAGCGKTYVATLHAVKCLKDGLVDKIVITRPNVAVDDNDIGYLPGDILKKMTPWMMPVLDVLAEYYTQAEIEFMLEEGVIEMVPIAFIRGRTFKRAYILFDEAQNSTASSMLSVLTRFGEGSKMVVTGDIKQGDRGLDNGLSDFIKRFENSNHIGLVQFERKDVERHPVIKEILKIYKDLG